MDVNQIIEILKQLYPEPKCELNYTQPHELLIAARLSAQCTDKRVNIVTPALFARYRTIADFAAADITELENMVKTCGLYKTKAANIKQMCANIQQLHDGVIPCHTDELLSLAGIGRKTANLIRGELYGKPAIVADTHVIRLSNRLGLTSGKDAYKVEQALWKIIPPEESLQFCHRLVLHGRAICKARKPDCQSCGLKTRCKYCNSGKVSPE